MSLNNLMMTLNNSNTSNTINDSLYLSKTSEAKTQILSTNILLTCRTQQTRESQLIFSSPDVDVRQ